MKNYIILSLVCVWSMSSTAQDLHSSNLQNLSQIYNPALTALKNDVDATITHRTQWRSLSSPFTSMNASIGIVAQPKHREDQGYLAFGLNSYSEQMSNQASITSFSLNPTYHLPFTKKMMFSAGLNIGYYGTQINPEGGTWESQHNGLVYDPSIDSGEEFARTSTGNVDAGTGFLLSVKSDKIKARLFQVGFAAFHLNKPDISYLKDGSSKLPIRAVINASSAIPLGRKGSYIEVLGVYQNQLKFNSLTIGAMGKVKLAEKAATTSSVSKVKEIYAGLGMYVRNADAFILNATVQSTNFSASLAYDITVSNLKMANKSRGALELQLQFMIPSLVKRSRF